jgi:hypothetical protein
VNFSLSVQEDYFINLSQILSEIDYFNDLMLFGKYSEETDD